MVFLGGGVSSGVVSSHYPRKKMGEVRARGGGRRERNILGVTWVRFFVENGGKETRDR